MIKLIKLKIFFLQSVIMIVLMFLFFGINSVNAQYNQFTHFSQLHDAPLSLAPSFAGDTDGSRVSLNYRNQWPGVSSFSTFAFGFDHYFQDYRSGIGVFLFRDQAGSANLATTNAGLLYSYDFNIDQNWKMRPGIHFRYSQRTLNVDELIFRDQIDVRSDNLGLSQATVPDDETYYFDASASVIAYRKNVWAGIAFDHLMMPDQSITEYKSNIPLQGAVFGAYKFRIDGPGDANGENSETVDNIEENVSVNFIYKRKGTINQLDIGANYYRGPASIGLMYRGVPIFKNPVYGTFHSDALILIAGFRRDGFRIGYSFDFTISNLAGSTRGAHEVSLIYEFNQQPRGPGKASIMW